MPSHNKPNVTVGLPVFNGERTIRVAIETVLSQTFENIVLVISDNCSTDSTPAICREYAASDSRIRFHRQDTNIGGERNFDFVLRQAESEYFMWASADDTRSPDFIELNLAFLESHSDYIASTCPTRFENGDFDELKMGDSSLSGDVEDRFLNFFRTWHANGRFCSLFRRSVLLENYKIGNLFLGCDWALVLRCSMAGKMHRCDDGWIAFGAFGLSSKDVFKIYRRHWYEWLFPFAKLYLVVSQLSAAFSLGTKLKLFFIFVRLNILGAWVQLLRSLIRPLSIRLRNRQSANSTEA